MSKISELINYNGKTLKCIGYAEPFIKGKMYLSNGDVGYPDEGGEVVIETIYDANNNDIIDTFTDQEFEEITEKIISNESRF